MQASPAGTGVMRSKSLHRSARAKVGFTADRTHAVGHELSLQIRSEIPKLALLR
jgi:hypothetical protein